MRTEPQYEYKEAEWKIREIGGGNWVSVPRDVMEQYKSDPHWDYCVLYSRECTTPVPPTASAEPVKVELVEWSGRTIELKTDPQVYDDVEAGKKPFELRLDDRGYQVGDDLLLKQTQHTGAEMKAGAPLVFTGKETRRRIGYILRGPIYGLAEGWVIAAFAAPPPTMVAAPDGQRAAIPWTWSRPYSGHSAHTHIKIQDATGKCIITGYCKDDEDAALICTAINSHQSSALASSPSATRTTLKPMGETGNEWYFNCDGHYIDVERDDNGKYSVYFRDRTTNNEGWLDQAESPSGAPADHIADAGGMASQSAGIGMGELPPLPEPFGTYLIEDNEDYFSGESRQRYVSDFEAHVQGEIDAETKLFTADQMRAYAIAARSMQAGGVGDAEIIALARQFDPSESRIFALPYSHIVPFARNLLSRHVAAVPGWSLDFRPASERPTEQGDYILYNQCDGYHIVEAWFDDGEFSDFWVFAASKPISKDFYCAWAKLPDTLKDLYPKFARDADPTAQEGDK